MSLPAPIGPYSYASVSEGLVFSSGCIGVGSDGDIVSGGIKAQTKQALHNLSTILKNNGSSLSSVKKVTVFLTCMDDYAQVNEIYAATFTSPFPARTCIGNQNSNRFSLAIEVSRLPKNALVEIEAIAVQERIELKSKITITP
jgi:2-iminobutanoate/2-iminopropanoate deaminase